MSNLIDILRPEICNSPLDNFMWYILSFSFSLSLFLSYISSLILSITKLVTDEKRFDVLS